MAIHHRYGDLEALASKTHHRCHICHERVDLHTWGLVDVYGAETATVDHLLPQSFGGDDDPDNLLIAHLGCNASRGNRSARDARFKRTGTVARPWSTEDRLAAALATTAAMSGAAGAVFAVADDDGRPAFNKAAAARTFVFGGIFLSLIALT